jgi:peptidoglycan/LPS O-acetylase OafA/YrhL
MTDFDTAPADDYWMRARLVMWVAVFMAIAMLAGDTLLGEPGSFWGGLAILVAATTAAILLHKRVEDWRRKRRARS